MRVVAAQETLAAALGAAGRVASTKSTIPILGLVLLRAEDGRVSLEATDMELSLRLAVEATVEESGAVVLPRVSADVVRSMAAGHVTIEHRANEGVAEVSGGNSSFTLNCMQASEFPELPRDEGEGVAIPADVLAASVERVARAASRDETRPVLTGVLVRLDANGLTMVATDSYRLALRRAPLESPPPEPREAILPARALSEAVRLAAGARAEAATLILGESQATIRVGEARLTTRVIDGQFPDYRQLIPESFEHEVRFDRAELTGVLGRVGVLAQRGTPVRLGFADGAVTVSASQEQVGQGTESLPVAFSGDALEVGFNVDFLRAGVEGVEGDEVRLGLISPLRPGLIRGEQDDYRYLLMPIRLNA